MLTLIVGGSLVAGSDNPHPGTLMPLGPSTPSVGLGLSSDRARSSDLVAEGRYSLMIVRSAPRAVTTALPDL
jgi:hypothetical protein